MKKKNIIKQIIGFFQQDQTLPSVQDPFPLKEQKTLLSEDEVAERQSLWEALSELWRATRLKDYDLKYVGKVLADSRFSWTEIEEIFLQEVAPVVNRNLKSAAGLSESFDPVWLRTHILENMKKSNYKELAKENREFMTEPVHENWRKVEAHFRNIRNR